MIEISEQARNRWSSILPLFGIETRFLSSKQGPCPICGGKDRFRFDNKEGRGTWICNACKAGDGFKLLMLHTGKTFAEVAGEVRAVLGQTRVEAAPKPISSEAARKAYAELYRASAPIGDDQASAYLAGRGFRGPFPNDLRFCASVRVSDHPTKQWLPALLAVVRDVNGRGVNIHRTYLEGASKANMPSPRKMMAGSIPAGAAIRLGRHDGRLGIAEGIETALAVTRDFGIICWSAINSTMLEKFIVPENVKEFHIFGDNDMKFGGQASAFTLAHRVATMKNAPSVEVHLPAQAGRDWADFEQLASA